MPPDQAFIIAARRTALGRVGGLHRHRRLDALTTPVIAAALADARLMPADVDEMILGSTAQPGNPARIVALAAGLPDICPAWTLDRQAASGLDAVLAAIRVIGTGGARVVLAGGADTLSMAPWLVARPRALHQTPHFIDPALDVASGGDLSIELLAAEVKAARTGISRADQDAFVRRSHAGAGGRAEQRAIAQEIVALRSGATEARDEPQGELDLDEIAALPPLAIEDGTVTAATASTPADGAAMFVVVDAVTHMRLGAPPALRLLAAKACGIGHDAPQSAAVAALSDALAAAGFKAGDLVSLTMSETSAVEALEIERALGLGPDIINRGGGALVRGHPAGAAGAVALVRLFSDLVRSGRSGPARGAVTQPAGDGLASAAVFESVSV